MVGSYLTEEMIDAGVALVRKLDESGVSPCAAFWIYSPEENDWILKIANQKVGEEGPRKIYGKIQRILLENPDEFKELSLDDISLARPDESFIQLLRRAVDTGDGISGIRFKDAVVEGAFIDDAYIYRAQ
jgi:hypothetical protein